MSANHPINIHSSTAGESYSVEGEKNIQAGENKSRLQLEGSDTRCHIVALKQLDDWWTFSGMIQRRTYVKATIEGQELYVNIGSVANRLHETPEQIETWSKWKPEHLGQFIVEQTTILSKALTYYEQIATNYEKNNPDSQITKKQLMDIVKTAGVFNEKDLIKNSL